MAIAPKDAWASASESSSSIALFEAIFDFRNPSRGEIHPLVADAPNVSDNPV